MSLTRRQLLTSAAAGAAVGAAAKRPNIVFLMADDLGFGDLSCFGSQEIETPHLDGMAREGMKFKRYYAASAVCTPTRASILTGRYPLRFDIRAHFPDGPEHLPAGTVTLPGLLREAGYACMHIGKWHLGGLRPELMGGKGRVIPGPREHGFDHYLAMYETPPIRGVLVRQRLLYREGARHLVRDDLPEPLAFEHWEDYKSAEAVKFIEQSHKAGKPFFLNLWFDAPHAPYEPAPEPHVSRYQGKVAGDGLLYRSMVSHMDACVGRVRAKLRELGIEGDTLLIFTSDNGPAFQGSTGGLKGRKADLHEGGIRVPMIACWRGRIRAGSVSDEFAHSTDFLPTLCAAAGIGAPERAQLDGKNILPYWLGEGRMPERGPVFWQMDLYKTDWQGGDGPVPYKKPTPFATEVARLGKWKLLARDGVPTELIDLEADPGENRNLLGSEPGVEKQLTAELREWLNAPRDRSWRSLAPDSRGR